jgi:hypothetical protein
MPTPATSGSPPNPPIIPMAQLTSLRVQEAAGSPPQGEQAELSRQSSLGIIQQEAMRVGGGRGAPPPLPPPPPADGRLRQPCPA